MIKNVEKYREMLIDRMKTSFYLCLPIEKVVVQLIGCLKEIIIIQSIGRQLFQ